MEPANPPHKNYKFKISKMDCAACAETITDTVKGIDGVIDAKLNFINETLYVETQKDKPAPKPANSIIFIISSGAGLSF